jgi:hypothetical protein
MQAGGTVADPTTAYLFRAPVEPIESEPQKQKAMVMLPAAIDVEVWEEDGTWSAHSPVLGVTAMADSEAALYGEFAEQVSEFWDILNERYETLSDELRRLLDLRGQTSLRFVKR